jgi:hypothetical protein
MRTTIYFAAGSLIASPAMAGEITVKLDIPRLKVAEYHKPYVAVWIEDAAGKHVGTLDVWYDIDLKGTDSGTKWLPELRTWWRRAGRTMKMPANGVSGPTQGPGPQTLTFKEGAGPLKKLVPGSYKLSVEAVREVGGREVVSVPFQWPPAGARSASAQGTKELGAVSIALKP